MKISMSPSTVLMAIVIAVLVAVTPFALAEFVKSGELYVLSRRFVDDMLARLHGPGRLRFYFSTHRSDFVRCAGRYKRCAGGCASIPLGLGVSPGKSPGTDAQRSDFSHDLIAVAILLDVASQLLIFRLVHPGAALILGPVLIGLPYASSRALTNRIVRLRPRRLHTAESSDA